MQDTVKGPIPAFIAYLLLLTAAYAGLGDGSSAAAPLETDVAPFVVAAAVANLLPEQGDPSAPAIFALALAAGLWFGVVLAWTGNRVVSLLAGALWCLHPAFRVTVLGGGTLLLDVLPAVGIPAVLYLRERAWEARRLAGRAGPLQGAALAVAVATMLSGPSGVALGLLVPLVDTLFHHSRGGASWRDGSRLAHIGLAGTMGVVIALVAEVSTASGVGDRLAQLLLLPLHGTMATALLSAFIVAGVLALGLAWRSLATSPKWLVIYVGFGMTWFIACDGISELISGRGGLVIGAAALTFLLPAVAWRYLVAMFPEPQPRFAPPPTLDPSLLRAGLPPFPTLPVEEEAPLVYTHDRVPFPSAPEVRASVETAVEAAISAAVGAMPTAAAPESGSAAPGRRYAEEWDRYADEWDEKEGARGAKVLGEEWSDANLDRNLFVNYCLPYLTRHTRVLEIGQGGGKFTRLIAPEVARVICLDVARSMLERARTDVGDLANVSYVLGDGRGLSALGTGSVDFVFSYDVFVHLDQEDMFLYLEDMRRVLRPGGRAVVSFANLLDPLGFKQFQHEAARHRTGKRAPGRINFLSPDLVRTLVTSAGMGIESIHLAANNRDMVAIIERPTS